eukprot:6492794-Amphidinium_carterae.2
MSFWVNHCLRFLVGGAIQCKSGTSASSALVGSHVVVTPHSLLLSVEYPLEFAFRRLGRFRFSAMSKHQLAALKGVETKKRLRQAQEGIQAVQEANKVFNETSLDTVAEEVMAELKKDRTLLYNVRIALANGTLSAILGENNEPTGKDKDKKEMLRSTCRKVKDLPQKIMGRFLKECAPEVHDLWNNGELGDFDMHDIYCYALHTTRDSDLGWRLHPSMQEITVFLSVLAWRYEQMGRRLAKGLPDTLDYWSLDTDNKTLVYTVNGEKRTLDIWLPELPDDAEIKNANMYEGAVLSAKSMDIEIKCTAFLAGNTDEDTTDGFGKHMVKESASWNVPEHLVAPKGDDEVSTITATTSAPSTTATSESSNKRKAGLSTLEARLKAKARQTV